jgi:hypothetical protein
MTIQLEVVRFPAPSSITGEEEGETERTEPLGKSDRLIDSHPIDLFDHAV